MEPAIWISLGSLAISAFSLVLAVRVHFRTKAIAGANLRRDAVVELDLARSKGESLEKLLASALESRKAVMAARGLYNSGAMQKFVAQHAADSEEARSLKRRISEFSPQSFEGMTFEGLTERQTRIRQLLNRVEALSRRYTEEMAADDRQRDHIREDMRAEMAARTNRPDPFHR